MKTVLITGAGRGLGASLAHNFKFSEKYKVILHFKSKLLVTGFFDWKTVKGDLRSAKTISRLAKHDIDILINNAGVYCNKPFPEMSEDDFRKAIDTNLLAPILLTNALWPTLKKNSGLVININSLAGKQGSNGETAYCTSKHGLRGFSSALQFDATRDGIRVIDVFLGAMKTDMTKNRKDFDKLIDPKEAAQIILNLCNNYQTLRITEIDISRGNY